MRKLRKGVVIALSMAMGLSLLAGCGDEKNVSGTIDTDTTTSTDSEETSSSSVIDDDMSIEDYIEMQSAGVTLGDYIGLEYTWSYTEVTESDVQSAIESFVSSCTEYEYDYESEAQEGDLVNIDFVGTIDGVEFDGGSTDGAGYDLTLGSGALIDGYEDQIVGHVPGETFDVEVTFPDDYGVDELNGQDAVFSTTLNYISIATEATYSDELVAANTSYSTMEEYEAYLWEYLEETAYESALSTAQNTIMTLALNNAAIESISEDEVNEYVDKIISNIESMAESYGIEYATLIYYYYGYDDEDEFKDYVVQVCEEVVKEEMVVCAIAKAEGLTVTEDEVTAYTEQLAEDNSTDVSDIEDYYTATELRYYTLAEKVMEFLLENAVQVEASDEE